MNKKRKIVSSRKEQLTTAAGRPVGDNQNSLTVGPRGPIVFEDFLLFEKMAVFNRERIPERVVHAKGSGAYGHFVCTNPDMPRYTTARLFETVRKTTPVFLRFSTVGGEKGSADTERDPRGFALKFYYSQPGNLFRLMDHNARKRLMDNIAVSMASISPEIQKRQLQHFYKADPDYGRGVAEALGLKDWANYVSA